MNLLFDTSLGSDTGRISGSDLSGGAGEERAGERVKGVSFSHPLLSRSPVPAVERIAGSDFSRGAEGRRGRGRVKGIRFSRSLLSRSPARVLPC